MTESNEVHLTLHSDQNGESVTTHFNGQAFQKGSSIYIRYTETPESTQQEVRTTVRISKDEIKIMRHGGVEAEQSFRQGEQLTGFYRSPFTRFGLITHTSLIHNELNGYMGKITWEYDLYVHEQLNGTFKVSLDIQAAQSPTSDRPKA
ncbi:DUF1934 domain-containing protein [Paenibacillus bovis]|uniref:DUF1934 domain-containing protein n=1 Tax=Paenibacillus bovis TaxID=1616788 RepID=A0A172ZM22_9BACL|nr:DUF1934 domain-containing protein [Paenibacillus bovis]ANF98603.1 hypothetical protein AR543_03330 [Paenibacillus bovis]